MQLHHVMYPYKTFKHCGILIIFTRTAENWNMQYDLEFARHFSHSYENKYCIMECGSTRMALRAESAAESQKLPPNATVFVTLADRIICHYSAAAGWFLFYTLTAVFHLSTTHCRGLGFFFFFLVLHYIHNIIWLMIATKLLAVM